MTDQFNGLTAAESERLYMLSEECGEVVQAIGKILRHGLFNTHPSGGPDNLESLRRELSDVFTIVEIMKVNRDFGDFSPGVNKDHNKHQYTHHQQEVYL